MISHALKPLLTTLFTAFFALGLLTFAAPSEAQAQSVSVEVRVIVGSSNGGGVDSSLSNLSSRLQRQFARFNSFRQHGMQSFQLSVGQSRSLSLPGGSSASIELVSVSGGEQELRIQVPGGGSTMRTRGGLFFVGGANVSGGTLILAIST
jgi:hypothetical protein